MVAYHLDKKRCILVFALIYAIYATLVQKSTYIPKDVIKSRLQSNPETINKFLDDTGNYYFNDRYYTNNHKQIDYNKHVLYQKRIYQKYDKYILLKKQNTSGIVYSAGNIHHLQMIYVSIQILFSLHNQYDIEIFVDKTTNKALQTKCEYIMNQGTYNFTVNCIEIDDIFVTLNIFANKPNVLIQSSFEHILFLDTDNIPVRNPNILFNSGIYKKYGAILWPDSHVYKELWCSRKDLHVTAIDPRIDKMSFEVYKSWNITYDPAEIRYLFNIESGQLLINSIRHIMALMLTIDCCNSELMQSLVYGDKDCFKLAFLRTRSLFYILPRIPDRIYGGLLTTRHAMAQYWIDQKILFIHGHEALYCGDMFRFIQIWDANYDCNDRLNINKWFLPFSMYGIHYDWTNNQLLQSTSDEVIHSVQTLNNLYHTFWYQVCSIKPSEYCECMPSVPYWIWIVLAIIIICIICCFMYCLKSRFYTPSSINKCCLGLNK